MSSGQMRVWSKRTAPCTRTSTNWALALLGRARVGLGARVVTRSGVRGPSRSHRARWLVLARLLLVVALVLIVALVRPLVVELRLRRARHRASDLWERVTLQHTGGVLKKINKSFSSNKLFKACFNCHRFYKN